MEALQKEIEIYLYSAIYADIPVYEMAEEICKIITKDTGYTYTIKWKDNSVSEFMKTLMNNPTTRTGVIMQNGDQYFWDEQEKKFIKE